MTPESGYYGYTDGKLVIKNGDSGYVGVQLEQGFPRLRQRRAPKRSVETTCRRCGKALTTYLADRKNGKGAYCDLDCRYPGHDQPKPKCETCGRKVKRRENRFCSPACVRRELPAAMAAVIQALRFEFHLSAAQILGLMDTDERYVSRVCSVDSATIHQWEDRQYRQDAIEAAQKILDREKENP